MEKKLRRQFVFLSLTLSVAMVLSGCKINADGVFGILGGVLSWSNQNWPASVSVFMEIEEMARKEGNSNLREYAVYGIASTYLAQDEYDPALVRLSEIENAASDDIRSGVFYQSGIIAFRKGEYDGAAQYFRKALEIDPSRIDAKINLELSRRSLVEKKADRSSSSSGLKDDGESGSEGETIFNLVRKKEQDRWKNQEDESINSEIADY